MKLIALQLKASQHHLAWSDIAKLRFDRITPIYLSALESAIKAGETSVVIWDKCYPDWLDCNLTDVDKRRLDLYRKTTLSYAKNGIDLCLTIDSGDLIEENGLKTLEIEFEPESLIIKSVLLTCIEEMAHPEALARLLEYCEPPI
jgi:hypothetical protein